MTLELPAAGVTRGLVGLLALLLITVAVQWGSGNLSSELASYPDEAAHFVTGLLVHDYVCEGLGTSPMAYAEQYYLHFPKVAFGAWPPAFYLAQAPWYLVAGTSTTSGLLLVAAFLVLSAWCLFLRLTPRHGITLAFVASTAYVLLPEVRLSVSRMMSETMLAATVLLAVFAFADYLRSRSRKALVGFALAASAALLTKGSGASIALTCLFSILITRSFSVLRRWELWLAGACILLISAPFYILTADFDVNVHDTPFLADLARWTERLYVLGQFVETVGPVGMALMGAGVLMSFLRRDDGAVADARRFDQRVAIAWILGTLLFQVVCPITGDRRYFVPCLAAVVVLAAAPVGALVARLRERPRALWLAPIFIAFPAWVLSTSGFPDAGFEPVHGYRALANELPLADTGTVVLVSAGSVGEGVFVVERRLADPERSGIVLRGTKVLASSDWFGKHYEAHFRTEDEVREYLRSVPVHFVVVDDITYGTGVPQPHQAQLLRAIQGAPDEFVPFGHPLITVDGIERTGSVKVFEQVAARGKPPRDLRVDIRGGHAVELQGR